MRWWTSTRSWPLSGRPEASTRSDTPAEGPHRPDPPGRDRRRLDPRGIAIAVLSFAAAAAATLWIIGRSGVDPAEALRYLPLQAHLLALAAYLVDLVARGVRVSLVARGLRLPLTLVTSIEAQLAGEAAAAVTPARIGADPAKIAVLRRDGSPIGSCGALLIAEMSAESAVLLLSALVILVGPWDAWIAVGLAGYAVVVSFAGIVAFFASRASESDPPRFWRWLRLGRARWEGLRHTSREFRADTTRLRRLSPSRTVAILAATCVHIGARVIVLALLVLPLASIGSVTLPPGGLEELVLRPFFVLYATALLPPPGGGGGVEIVFATVLGGVLPEAALASTLVWWRFYTFYLGAALGALLILRLRWYAPRRPTGDDTDSSRETSRSFS